MNKDSISLRNFRCGYEKGYKDALLKEKTQHGKCVDCKYYSNTKFDFSMCKELDICVDKDFYCAYFEKQVNNAD